MIMGQSEHRSVQVFLHGRNEKSLQTESYYKNEVKYHMSKFTVKKTYMLFIY